MTDTTNTIETTEAEARELRSQMFKHEDIFEWLIEKGLVTEDSTGPEIIAAFAARRNEYRRTSRYQALVAAHNDGKADRDAAALAERAAAKAAKEALAEVTKAERDAEKAAKATAKAEARMAADQAKVDAGAKPEPTAEKASKPAAKGKGTKGTKAADDDVFG